MGTSDLTVLNRGLASNVTLGTVHNAPLASAPGREYHPLIFGTLGAHGGKVKRERERVCVS